MNNLSAIVAFSDSDVEDVIIARALQNATKEQTLLYSTTSFDLDKIPDRNYRFMFRFEKVDIIQLADAFQLPKKFETADQHVISGLTGLCMLLRRFSYPNRLKEMQSLFGLHFTSISKLLRVISEFIYDKWGYLLLDFGGSTWFTTELQAEFASIVHAKGAPLNNCIGFLDGTARAICRPGRHQKELYSGHKRHHCLKFQSITLPNGIVIHMSLPFPGKHHDAFMLRETKLMQQLELYCSDFCLYGDEGYPFRKQLMRPFSRAQLSDDQLAWNKHMSVVRECVEWSFGKIVQQFAFVDFKKNQKLFLQPVGQYYLVATLFTNAHTCFYGSQTSIFFNTESPDITEYFK